MCVFARASHSADLSYRSRERWLKGCHYWTGRCSALDVPSPVIDGKKSTAIRVMEYRCLVFFSREIICDDSIGTIGNLVCEGYRCRVELIDTVNAKKRIRRVKLLKLKICLSRFPDSILSRKCAYEWGNFIPPFRPANYPSVLSRK